MSTAIPSSQLSVVGEAGSSAFMGMILLCFPQEQWRHLDSTQKEQYWDLMLETYGKMVSGGEGMGPFDGRR